MLKHCFIVTCCWLVWTGAVQAHDPGLSTATLKLEDGRLIALLTFSPQDIQLLLPTDPTGTEPVPQANLNLDAVEPRLQELARSALQVEQQDQPLLATQVRVGLDDEENFSIQLIFPFQQASRLRVQSPFLDDLPRGHCQYLRLADMNGNLLGEALLDASNNVFEKPLGRLAGSESGHQPFTQFLFLGLEHIVTGYDHLLFLLGLLIVGGSFLSAAKIITSFTLAHSISLALATFQVVQLPTWLVEPLIAVSIIYVGIENILSRDVERRWLLTFGFGLVHGLGFASLLGELGAGANSSAIAVPLLSFNVGIEIGQIAMAAVALPVIWWLGQRPSYGSRYVTLCSVAVALAGTYWLAERVLLN